MNNNGNNQKLFENFGKVTKKEWTDKAIADLKGADFNRKLVWRNLNQIPVPPFYLKDVNREFLQNTGLNATQITNYRRIEVISAVCGNSLAKKAIKEGINGLLFEIIESVDPSVLLEGVDLTKIELSFHLSLSNLSFAEDFLIYVESQKISANHLRGYLSLDIISDYLTNGKLEIENFKYLDKLITLTKEYPNYKAITLSGNTYVDSGANQVQEIAFTLNSLVFLIDELSKLGADVHSIFDNLHIQLAIGPEFFIEIAKFRAFKSLINQVAKKYDVLDLSPTLSARTSIWSKSVLDAHTNMLRATTEAMSAFLGNVNSLEIDPYDNEFELQNDFSSRIAGNIAIILEEESYFGKVQNPVDGSYYIEEISSEIAQKSLELFKEIEKDGGFYKNFENEVIQNQIAEVRFKKIKLLSKRKLGMVGINKYPNLMERLRSDELSTETEGKELKVLKPRRASIEIEAIRKKTEEYVAISKERPVVELVSFGNLTMRKARAAFAYDFMGVSGYTIFPERSFDTFEEAATSSSKSLSNIVVICSSDEDYLSSALKFISLFRANNTEKTLILAGNPTKIEKELKKAGLDGCINMQSDLIESLIEIQNKVQKPIKYSEV